MRSRTPLLLGLLVPFLAVSSVAVSRFGYLTLWRLPLQDWGTAQMFADLTVAMVLVTSWIVRDARARGVAAWPFLLLTLATDRKSVV